MADGNTERLRIFEYLTPTDEQTEKVLQQQGLTPAQQQYQLLQQLRQAYQGLTPAQQQWMQQGFESTLDQQPLQLTAAQWEAQVQAVQRQQQAQQQHMRPRPENDDAAHKAHALLLRLLSPKQRKEYALNGQIRERAADKLYVLNYHTWAVAVYSVTGEKVSPRLSESWCVFCPNCPREDTLVAQLLLIRDDPEKLRAKAHVTEYTVGPPTRAAAADAIRGVEAWNGGNDGRRFAALRPFLDRSRAVELMLRRAGY